MEIGFWVTLGVIIWIIIAKLTLFVKSFFPDPEGENIGAEANDTIHTHTLQKFERAKKRQYRESHGRGCGCQRCRDGAVSDMVDATDALEWSTQTGAWEKKYVVKDEPPGPIVKKNEEDDGEDENGGELLVI